MDVKPVCIAKVSVVAVQSVWGDGGNGGGVCMCVCVCVCVCACACVCMIKISAVNREPDQQRLSCDLCVMNRELDSVILSCIMKRELDSFLFLMCDGAPLSLLPQPPPAPSPPHPLPKKKRFSDVIMFDEQWSRFSLHTWWAENQIQKQCLAWQPKNQICLSYHVWCAEK